MQGLLIIVPIMVDVVTDLKKYPKNLKKIHFDQFNPDSLVSELHSK